MVYEDNTVEVVYFMLYRPRQELMRIIYQILFIKALCLDPHGPGPRYVQIQPGEAQAAFFIDRILIRIKDHGIDKNDWRRVFVMGRRIQYEDAMPRTHLIRGKTDAILLKHGRDHILDEGEDAFTYGADRYCLFPQERVWIFYDLSNHGSIL